MKSKGMKDTAPGPDGIPYSVYGKFWVTAGPLVLDAWKYSNEKGELSRDQLLSTIMLHIPFKLTNDTCLMTNNFS